MIHEDLFEQEQRVLDEANLRINKTPENEAFSHNDYTSIVKEYSHMLKHLRRMTKMNDRITKELNQSQLEADAANKAKSDFLANMSHEIRTPINAVLGMSEMILRETTAPSIIDYAANIQNASKTLLAIVNDILDLSKIESGKMDIIPTEYEIASLLNDLVNMISLKVEAKGLELILDIAEDLPRVLYGDEIRVKQVAVNILTNAVKYTHEGSVTLSLQWERSGNDTLDLIFSVKDTGIGIKEEDMGKLFSSFERIEEERNRTIEGTGLGMSIVLQLLKLMGSKLNVTSTYGEGSEFGFCVSQKIINEEAVGDFKEIYERSRKETSVYYAQFIAPRAKILIVDDNEMNLKVACGLLKQTKIQIVTATSGMQCLELIGKVRFDIIFTDHMMPVMDGIETLHAMKEQKINLCRDVPVVVLTANAISGAKEMYLKEGFDDYLTKPVDPKELEIMIQKYLPKELVEACDEQDDFGEAAVNALPEIDEVDIAKAVQWSGSVDMVFQMFHDFYMCMPEKAEMLERYLSEERIKDYTIEVHSLKSSARIIGAMGLSVLAEHLEQCGNAGNISEIREKTPELIVTYRRICDNIKPYADINEAPSAEKAAVSDDELIGLIIEMRECMEVFDIDAVDGHIKTLSGCKLTPEVAELFERIKVCAVNVDMDGGIELIDQMLSEFVI